MYLTVLGVVLRSTDVGDRDALLTVLTREHGKLTIKARGLYRKNSPLTAACQLFAYSEFTLFEYKGQYSVNDAHVLEVFQNLRLDIQRLALASYFAQTAEVLALEDCPTPELQSLLLNCFYVLSEQSVPCNQVKSVFELRAASISGYMPELTGCGKCGSIDCEWFHISEGCLICKDCRTNEKSSLLVRITSGTLAAMRYICFCSPKKLFSFRLAKEDLLLLGNVAERYFLAQMDRSFSTLDYYHSFGSLAGIWEENK